MPEFGPLQVLVLVTLFAIMSGATWRVGGIWRDQATAGRIFKTMRSWWLWGDALLRGWVRALAAGLVGGWLLVVSMGLAALLATDTIESSGGFALLALLVGGLFLSLAVVASIILVNRPRFAVPPHARDEPGALAEWRSSRSRSHRPSAQ